MSVPSQQNTQIGRKYIDTEIDEQMAIGEYLSSNKRQQSQIPRNPTSLDKHGIFIGSSFPDFPSPRDANSKEPEQSQTFQTPTVGPSYINVEDSGDYIDIQNHQQQTEPPNFRADGCPELKSPKNREKRQSSNQFIIDSSLKIPRRSYITPIKQNN